MPPSMVRIGTTVGGGIIGGVGGVGGVVGVVGGVVGVVGGVTGGSAGGVSPPPPLPLLNSGAEQLTVVLPAQVQFHGPVPVGVLAAPPLHKLLVGIELTAVLLAVPHAPATSNSYAPISQFAPCGRVVPR